MPNRSVRDQQQGVAPPGYDKDGNRLGDDRPVPGAASAQKVHAALMAMDSQSASASTPQPKSTPAPATTQTTDPATRDLSAIGAANKIRDTAYATAKAIDDQSQ